MGIKKAVKKAVRTFAKFEATRLRVGGRIIDKFIPGIGVASNEVAKLYDKLGATQKTKVHKAKGKAAKVRMIKSLGK